MNYYQCFINKLKNLERKYGRKWRNLSGKVIKYINNPLFVTSFLFLIVIINLFINIFNSFNYKEKEIVS